MPIVQLTGTLEVIGSNLINDVIKSHSEYLIILNQIFLGRSDKIFLNQVLFYSEISTHLSHQED